MATTRIFPKELDDSARARSTEHGVSSNLFLLAPELYGSLGGVAAYMQRLGEICSTYCDTARCSFVCLSLSHRACPARHGPTPSNRFELHTVDSKVGYVMKALRTTLSRPSSVALVGHLGLAPIAWVLKTTGRIRSYGVVLHGIEAWRRVDWMDRLAASGADFIVATTNYTAREFSAHNGIPLERFRIVPLGIRDEVVGNGGCERKTAGSLKVFTVGRLAARECYKGVDTLIKALPEARAGGLDVTLTVAGEGDDMVRLKQICADLKMNDYVTFLGSVSNERLRQLYRDCDVFAMPSKGEGFGIVFLEAMCYGKPCIGGNHGGTPEVIDQASNGYLVDHGDVSQLVVYLRALAGQPDLRQQMGRKAQEKVASTYLFPHLQRRWFSLLNAELSK